MLIKFIFDNSAKLFVIILVIVEYTNDGGKYNVYCDYSQ